MPDPSTVRDNLIRNRVRHIAVAALLTMTVVGLVATPIGVAGVFKYWGAAGLPSRDATRWFVQSSGRMILLSLVTVFAEGIAALAFWARSAVRRRRILAPLFAPETQKWSLRPVALLGCILILVILPQYGWDVEPLLRPLLVLTLVAGVGIPLGKLAVWAWWGDAVPPASQGWLGHRVRGDLARFSGRLAEAQDEYRSAIGDAFRHQNEAVSMLVSMARVALVEGRFQDAKRYSDAAIALAPACIAAIVTTVETAVARGETGDALAVLTVCLDFSSKQMFQGNTTALVAASAALCHALNGNRAQAAHHMAFARHHLQNRRDRPDVIARLVAAANALGDTGSRDSLLALLPSHQRDAASVPPWSSQQVFV